ncbi:hypothetical protein [Halobaculum limi]|uniref:hypothetical protein n=1 Tax=Halobaculum limi TaxID=3031916 RepID=UPI0024056A4E|nr:hypothetical protein [Halobaculum sp. YSMS11]
MTNKSNSELIDFVYEKVVEEDVWSVEIVEQGRRRTQKQVALNRSKAFYDESEEENDARIAFTSVFGDFLTSVDDLSEEYGKGTVEWYWELGRLVETREAASGLDEYSYKQLGELIPDENVNNNIVSDAKRVYELFPDRDVPDTDRVTTVRKIGYYADSDAEARAILNTAEDAGFFPMNREIRVWKDVKPDPDLQTVAEEINRRFQTYDSARSKVKFVRHVYLLCRVAEEDIPSNERIKTALQEFESE